MVATLKRPQIILSLVYWVVAAFLLWRAYIGDAAIDAASTTPVTHSPAFDTFAAFVIVAIVYAVACGVWWGIAAMRRRAAKPNG